MTDYSKLSDAEINNLVAERIGFTKRLVTAYGPSFTVYDAPKTWVVFPSTCEESFLPKFTTDTVAWGSLLRELALRKIKFSLYTSNRENGEMVWICDFCRGGWVNSVNESIGRAISECFLKATEKK